VNQQSGYWFGVIPKWYIFIQPLGFFIFLVAGIAETNRRRSISLKPSRNSSRLPHRVQLDELRAVLPREYINMVTVSAVATDLFLGGLARAVPAGIAPAGSGS